MSDTIEPKTVNTLFGRRTIYTSYEEVTRDNVVAVVNEVLAFHFQNLYEEEYLYWYRRGLQPILSRYKTVRPEINNKIVENHAEEIVQFKNGFFLTQPAFYVSRSKDERIVEQVKSLNEYLYRSGKQQVDNEVVDWFHTVGTGVLFIQPKDDEDMPVEVFSLDPRSAFVVYSLRPGNKPVLGINMVVNDKTVYFDVFTERQYFRLVGTVVGKIITYEPIQSTAISVEDERPNLLGKIPIVEYFYNSAKMGAFESVVTMLDAINKTASDRINGVEQFIQSLLIFYNCQLGEDDDGNPITPQTIREYGAIFLKSVGQDKADLKELNSQLDQTQTQVLVDYMYEQVLRICGMPSTTKGGHSTSDTGTAVLARDGWYQADTVARNTEDLFRKSNRYFDEIFLDILRKKVPGFDLKLTDFELQFVRNETANMQSKAQALQTLLSAGIHPVKALAWSGVSNDPQADFAMSEPYIKMIWGDPERADEVEAQGNGKGEATIIEEDRFTGNNETGGAV